MNDYQSCRRRPQMQMQQQKQRPDVMPGALTPLPANFTVAMSYVPMQTDFTLYDDTKALEVGTVFPVLNKPFTGKCVR